MDKQDTSRIPAEELLSRLLHLARQQKEALRQGGMERFVDLMAERTRLFDALRTMADGGGHQGLRRELAGLVEEILRIDGENAVVLESLLSDLSGEVDRLAQGRGRAIAYLRGAAGGAGPDRRVLDGRQ